MELFLFLLFFYPSFSVNFVPGFPGVLRMSAKQPGLRLSQIHPTGWIRAGERGPPPASQVCSPNPGENLDLGIWTL